MGVITTIAMVYGGLPVAPAPDIPSPFIKHVMLLRSMSGATGYIGRKIRPSTFIKAQSMAAL
jgi:hypothetical protein